MPDTLIQPAYLSIPPRLGSFGDEAADLMALAGRPLDAEQQLAVDAMLSYGPGGKWAAFESAVVEARQNGKTGGVLLPVVLYDLFLLPADRIVWTAHLFRTAREAFMDADSLIGGCDYLSRRVKKVTYANGEEAIELTSGARLEFLARSKGGGRGLGGKRLVMDEALYLSSESMGALIPTLAARSVTGDPQINYGASAGVADSTHLRDLRDRGRRGGDGSLVWCEWAAPGGWDNPGCEGGADCSHAVGVPGCSLDDEALWPLANPALGRRITYGYIRNERRALPPSEFGRERLGWWDEPAGTAAAFGAGRWEACVGDPAPAGTPLGALAVAVSYDQSRASVSGAAYVDDVVYVKPLDHRPGTGWLAARARELQDRHKVDVVVDGKGPAAEKIPDLENAGVRLRVCETVDVLDACAGLFDAVQDRTVRHQGFPELDAAVSSAVKRSVGDRWAWGRKQSTSDISVLETVTLAAWGARRPEPESELWAAYA